MLRQRSIQINNQERQQRLALFIFALVVLGVAAFCGMIGWSMLARGPRAIPAGRVEEYTTNVPRRMEVKKLAVSSWIRRRPEGSEDVVFVMHDQDGAWHAYLGMDTLTGCFLSWDPGSQ